MNLLVLKMFLSHKHFPHILITPIALFDCLRGDFLAIFAKIIVHILNLRLFINTGEIDCSNNSLWGDFQLSYTPNHGPFNKPQTLSSGLPELQGNIGHIVVLWGFLECAMFFCEKSHNLQNHISSIHFFDTDNHLFELKNLKKKRGFALSCIPSDTG